MSAMRADDLADGAAGGTTVQLTRMRRRHLRAVLRIEAQSEAPGWSAGLFMSELGRPDDRCYLVARLGGTVVGFGGMLQVDASGARVRSLVSSPYQGERLWQAVQAFPVLIEHGGVLAPQGDGFDERSRRTWIGQDRAGRVILGVTHNLITLAGLQAWLLASDLDLEVAFALDGGRSTGMVIQTPSHQESYPAFDRLPSVVVVYAP